MLATACFDGTTDDKGNRGCVGTDFFPSGQTLPLLFLLKDTLKGIITNGDGRPTNQQRGGGDKRYTGEYLLETQHGRGVFLHPSGFKYMGYMYAGAAEFCGRAVSPTGAEYQGMFSEGQPHGAGQVVYGGGAARDAGLWSRGRLLRLLCPSPAAVPFDRLLTGHYIGWYDRRVLHVQEPESQLETVLKELDGIQAAADRSTAQLDLMTNLKLRDRHAAGFPSHRYSRGGRRVSPVRLLAWNDTEEMCELQTYAYLTETAGRLDSEVVTISVHELLRSDSAAGSPGGLLQRASLLLMHASALNRADVVRLLVRTVRISPNVTDADGVTALICAAMRGHTAAVNTLLDHGADVNQLTDAGLSALSLCMALYHPDYSTRYHLDRLHVFTYRDINEELSGVLEWRGGQPEPCQRAPRPFPTRPVPLAARRQKAVRRPRPRRNPGPECAEPTPDIRQALVPGPGLTLEPQQSSSRRASRRRAEPARTLSPLPSPLGDADTAAASVQPPSRVETAQRPRTPTAESRPAAEVSDSTEKSQGQRSPSESVHDRAGSETGPGLGSSGSAPTHSGQPVAEGEVSRTSRLPPAWPADWPEQPDAMDRPPAASLLSARTDDGTDGSWWERLPAGQLRCCPSLERALSAAAAAAAEESRQETALRLIEAFCGGAHGSSPSAEYSIPCPGSSDMLAMIKVLLRRGASPEASKVPYPAVHHALLADDKPLLMALLSAGGDPNSRLSRQLGGLTPLHVACSLPGEGSLQLTALMLSRGADPASCCDPSPALLDTELLHRRHLPPPEQLGARTSLHVVCQRAADSYDQKVVSRRLMNLLEEAGADVEALCNGHSPITLALLAGDMTLAVDLMSRGADPLQPLGPPHHDALGLAVSPAVEATVQLEERKQMVRMLLAYGSDVLHQYPLRDQGRTGNILEFAQWINVTDDTLLTAPPHQLKGAQRGQKKQREAFLAFLAELVADEERRHLHMSPLVERGLFEDAELTTAEYGRATGTGSAPAEPPAADSSHRRRKRKLVVLSADSFCPICDRVLGKCFKGCPNYGRHTPKLTSAELQMEQFADDLLNLASDEEPGKSGRKGKRRKRRAEANGDEMGVHLELGTALLGPDGKPLKCQACHKNIKRRKVLCSACKQIIYCSKKCRTTDWDRSHQYTCVARSQVSLSRLQDSNATISSATRGSSAGSGPRRAADAERPGRPGRRAGGRRGASLDDRGAAGRRRAEGRAGRSLDARRHGHSGMTPIAGPMPPWLAAFMAQFEGLHVGECRHLILGEWYEDNCKLKENYSYV